MSDRVVDVRDLRKTYLVHERETGFGATVRAFFIGAVRVVVLTARPANYTGASA